MDDAAKDTLLTAAPVLEGHMVLVEPQMPFPPVQMWPVKIYYARWPPTRKIGSGAPQHGRG